MYGAHVSSTTEPLDFHQCCWRSRLIATGVLRGTVPSLGLHPVIIDKSTVDQGPVIDLPVIFLVMGRKARLL